MKKKPTKAELAAHLAEARDTSFIAIERPEDWKRIEDRFMSRNIVGKLDPITLGTLIALTIKGEDRARTEGRWQSLNGYRITPRGEAA